MGFGLDVWIHWYLIHSHNSVCRQYSAIAIVQTFQFTVLHALEFSLFISPIPATDLSQSHCHFKSHMKSSFHSLIPFLPLFCNCQFRRLGSIQFQAHILAGWRLKTRLNSTRLPKLILLFRHFAWTTRKTQPLYCWEGVLIAPFHSNEMYSNWACIFFALGMGLPSRCLAMNVYSDFTIPTTTVLWICVEPQW
jgi:hypothetical protein